MLSWAKILVLAPMGLRLRLMRMPSGQLLVPVSQGRLMLRGAWGLLECLFGHFVHWLAR